MSKKGSVYLRYDIVDEQDLREGVKRLAEGFGHQMGTTSQKEDSQEVVEAETEPANSL